MIISLGRWLPIASSDLPGSGFDGSGRSASGESRGIAPLPSLFGLAPGGVCRARPVARPAGELLPRRFTLTAKKPSHGKPHDDSSEAVYSLWHFPYPNRSPGGGRYPPPYPAESGLSSAACLQHPGRNSPERRTPRRSSPPPRSSHHNHTNRPPAGTRRGPPSTGHNSRNLE